jgi:phosphate transport system ATP-binding protein
MVQIEDFSCSYAGQKVVEGFNARFEKGSITALSGRSGIGKTTLLKAINRLHEVEENRFVSSGSIKVMLDGSMKDICILDPITLRRKVGYIFQSPVPLPMSIEKNVSFGLEIQGIKDMERVEQALRQAYLWEEVKERLTQSPEALSLGQQQRLTIARALVLEPEVLLFDEPTSALDSEATQQIEQLMLALKKDHTIILVTHDKGQIERVCDTEVIV